MAAASSTNGSRPTRTTTKTGASALIWEIFDHLVYERGLCYPHSMTIGTVVEAMKEEGIWFWRDERFLESQRIARELCGEKEGEGETVCEAAAEATHLDCDTFLRWVSPQAMLFLEIFSEELVIPYWKTFVTDMTYHFNQVKEQEEGQNAQYIPILADANPNKWGVSLCSVDGQRFSMGDYTDTFSIQSVSKPVTYGLCLEAEGEDYVDEWIGMEPAGRPFNTQDLDPESQTPFNASVNSGAIMAAGMFASRFPESEWKECVDKIRQTWRDLSGHDNVVGYSQETYESEKATAYNNIAIAYNLKGRRGLPRDVCIQKMLDVYLGCCSIEMSTEGLAVAAATFANGGVCPITRQEVFPPHVVRHVLSETMTCGMYDQAGHFAVNVGLPAKSGVSGALMVIVPNLMGLATFSPRLNKRGNSVRGLAFCQAVVGSHRIHIFEPLRSGNCHGKVDPRLNGKKDEKSYIHQFALAYQVGDAWGKRLHDIFVYSMVHVGMAAEDKKEQLALERQAGLMERGVKVLKSERTPNVGLSEKRRMAICEEYELIYDDPIDQAFLSRVIDEVKLDPTNMHTLQQLSNNRFIEDAFRRVIFFAIMEILVVDGVIDFSERETEVVLEISEVVLGLDRCVALMELNRYKRRIGARFNEVDPFEASPMARTSSRGVFSQSVLSRSISGSTISFDDPEDAKDQAEADGPMHPHSEVLKLRREVYLLNRKLEAMTQLLHETQAKKTLNSITVASSGAISRLSITHNVSC